MVTIVNYSLRSWCSWEFGISGTAKFIENSDATLSIELNYKILLKEVLIQHTYTTCWGGAIALTESSGRNSLEKHTTFKTLDGSAITYQALLGFDGYINVHLSADKLSTLVAQRWTKRPYWVSKVYSFGKCCCSTISGTTFYKMNGEAGCKVE
jgi:hypothetical protein